MKNFILVNAFSLQMIQGDVCDIHIATVTEEVIKILVRDCEWQSAIGHADTANVLSSILEVNVPYNRASVSLTRDNFLIVAQVTGGRLPEGCTKLPEGVQIVFKLVEII